jgi:hypothetical protein
MTSYRSSIQSVLARSGLALATLCVVGACDRGDAGSRQATQCARFCAALEKCDDDTDLQDCEDHCEADEVHSDAYFEARANCGEELSCNLWVTEVDAQGDALCDGACNLVDCVDDGLAKLKLTKQEDQVCSSIATKLNACDPSLSVSSSERMCSDATPLLSPDYMGDSQLCIERECGQIGTCLDDLADEYGTELRLFSGTITR